MQDRHRRLIAIATKTCSAVNGEWRQVVRGFQPVLIPVAELADSLASNHRG